MRKIKFRGSDYIVDKDGFKNLVQHVVNELANILNKCDKVYFYTFSLEFQLENYDKKKNKNVK